MVIDDQLTMAMRARKGAVSSSIMELWTWLSAMKFHTHCTMFFFFLPMFFLFVLKTRTSLPLAQVLSFGLASLSASDLIQ